VDIVGGTFKQRACRFESLMFGACEKEVQPEPGPILGGGAGNLEAQNLPTLHIRL
jgi:hypothetical protein